MIYMSLTVNDSEIISLGNLELSYVLICEYQFKLGSE